MSLELVVQAEDTNLGVISIVERVSGLTLASVGRKCSLILTPGNIWYL